MATEPTAITQRITKELRAVAKGDHAAFERLVELVYHDLRQLAHAQLSRRPQRDLQTTALVHELYLKLVDRKNGSWHNRKHFYGACATAMRNILIDVARASQRQKRGGPHQDLPLLEATVGREDSDAEWLIEIDQALTRLANADPALASSFELRYFGGYSAEEAGEILGVSKRTVNRHWNRACAWLRVAVARPHPSIGDELSTLLDK